MPLPILTEREWDSGYYDGYLYDMKAHGPPTPKPGKGSTTKPLGDQRPGVGVQKK